jgi:hypothetical protein
MPSPQKAKFEKLPWATKQSSLVLRIECLMVFIITLYVYHHLGGDWLYFAVVFFGIDLFLAGYLVNNNVGGLVYNIGHSYILPRSLLLLAFMVDIQWLVYMTLAWNAHISFDRSLGYGLKHEKFHLTHLGPIGKK